MVWRLGIDGEGVQGLCGSRGGGVGIGMKVKMDAAGRIVLPKPLRERLGLRPETELEAVEQSGGVLLRAV